MTLPTMILPDHHRHCDNLFVAAEESVRRGDWAQAAPAFARFRDQMKAHFEAEENLLFPAFEAATGSSAGPTNMMRHEHEQMRALLSELAAACEGRDGEAYAGIAETMLMLMQQHNMKEENILYPMCDRALGAAAERIGAAMSDMLESGDALNPARSKSESGRISSAPSMQPTLSFEQAPPISVPYRFFLTAPLFGVVAGVVLALLGPPTFESRWSPGALAMTHLIVVDFMLQAMCGSLLQFVAVVAGANIWRPRLVAAIVHPLITAGAVCLASAFLFEQKVLFLAAALVFVAALGMFLTVMAIALLRTPAHGASVHVLRLAVLGLLVTVALGATLAVSLGSEANLLPDTSMLALISVHVAWGLGGWALMLVIGVSYLVVPMFQLTPGYPAWLARLLPAGLFVVLLLWTLQLVPVGGAAQPWQSGVALAGMLFAGSYAVITLWLQGRRRRRQTDVTFILWRGAMLSLLAFALSWVAFEAWPQLGGHSRAPLWLGVLALPGLFLSVITGMLYKIMPFLNWLHLQQLGGMGMPLPNMKQMIPERAMRGQMALHFAALLLLLAAVPWTALAVPAGLTFAASCLWLEWNLLGAARVYARFRDKVHAAIAGTPDVTSAR